MSQSKKPKICAHIEPAFKAEIEALAEVKKMPVSTLLLSSMATLVREAKAEGLIA